MIDIEKYAGDYKGLPFENRMVAIRRDAVIATINKYPHARIAELGCAESPLFLHFSDWQEMYVVEPSQVFYKNAVKCAEERGDDRITCFHGFAQDYADALRSANLDIILISSLLHEIEDPAAFLSAVRKMCTNDTIVHINVPNAYSVHRILAKEMGLIADVFEQSKIGQDMQRVSVFSIQTLKKLVCEAGFTVIEEGSYFIKPFSHAQLEKCLSQGIVSEEILGGLSRLESYMPGLGAEIFVNCSA